MELEFLREILENPHISNLMKTRLVGADLFHADGQAGRQAGRQAGMSKLTVAFRNFTKARKKPVKVSRVQRCHPNFKTI
jgi:hypothetical protein